MTLKIERISSKRRTRIRLSGAFRSEHRDQVKAEIERDGPRITLDLEEVDLVDVEGVRFLNACEAEGISVLRCSPYIREWMLRERGRAITPTTRSPHSLLRPRASVTPTADSANLARFRCSFWSTSTPTWTAGI